MVSNRPTTIAPTVLILGLVLLSLLVSPVTPSYAASTVGNGSAASCTEAALRNAVALGGPISFNCGPNPHTITLGATIEIRKPTDIDGGGKITLSGAGKVRVLYVYNTRSTLSNLTIRDGISAKGGGLHVAYYSDVSVINCRFLNNSGLAGFDEEGGGAISARVSTLKVDRSYFEGNKGINGGAIYSMITFLTVSNSTFIANDTTQGGVKRDGYHGGFGAGGAIYTDGASYPIGSGGQIVLRNNVFRKNRAASQGGAVMTYGYPPKDTVLIDGAIFEDNQVVAITGTAANGGGLRHGNTPLILRNASFINNKAEAKGGAFWSGGNYASRIENVTFSGNEARTPTPGKGEGGAMYISDGSYTIVNVTLSNNYADFYGGGIVAANDNVSIYNSILANNWSGGGSRVWNQCSQAFSKGANNLQTPTRSDRPGGDYQCAPSIRMVDPKLSALGDFGGGLPSIALLAGSPAINAGTNCPATDQRGANRVGACDIGAFEFGGQVAGATPPTKPTLNPLGNAPGPNIEVSWSASPGATSYELLVASQNTLAAIPLNIVANENRSTLLLGAGTHTISVRACNGSGCSEYSGAAQVTTTAQLEQVYLPIIVR